MTAAEIIEALGGAGQVAFRLSHRKYGIVTAHAVRQWAGRNRIPKRYHSAIGLMAKDLNVELPAEYRPIPQQKA